MWQQLRSSRGFTLIEMLIVVTMIAILAAIALPRIDYAHFQIDGGMQAVATSMLAAQRQAVSRGHDVVVMFDAGNGRLRVLYDENNNGTEDAGERRRVIPLDTQVRFGKGTAPGRPFGSAPVNFTKTVDGLPAVTFKRNGSASETGGIYLTSVRGLSDPKHARDTRALEMIRATGRAEWFRYTGSTWRRGF